MSSPIHITVIGEPQPGGSKRAFTPKGWSRPVIADSNPKAKPWKAAVAFAARSTYDGPLLDGALRVVMTFYKTRPKGHFNTRGEVRPSAPRHPTTRPDALKLARSTEDALTGVIWRDDAQTVELILVKEFGEPARAEIEVSEITCPTQPVNVKPAASSSGPGRASTTTASTAPGTATSSRGSSRINAVNAIAKPDTGLWTEETC